MFNILSEMIIGSSSLQPYEMSCNGAIKSRIMELGRLASHEANLPKLMLTKELVKGLWKWCKFPDNSGNC